MWKTTRAAVVRIYGRWLYKVKPRIGNIHASSKYVQVGNDCKERQAGFCDRSTVEYNAGAGTSVLNYTAQRSLLNSILFLMSSPTAMASSVSQGQNREEHDNELTLMSWPPIRLISTRGTPAPRPETFCLSFNRIARPLQYYRYLKQPTKDLSNPCHDKLLLYFSLQRWTNTLLSWWS